MTPEEFKKIVAAVQANNFEETASNDKNAKFINLAWKAIQDLANNDEALNELFNSQDSDTFKAIMDYKPYDKLVHLLKKCQKNDDDAVKTVFKQALKMVQQLGYKLVGDHLVLPESGRLPNSSLSLTFTDPDTNQPHIVLIHNGKFGGQFATPAGKLDKSDIADNFDPKNLTEADITSAYVNGAIREFAEEALSEQGANTFFERIRETKPVFTTIDRDAFGIPEFDTLCDTRLITCHLGDIAVSTVKSWLKTPNPEQVANPKDVDAVESFCLPLAELTSTGSSVRSEQAGKYTNHFLTRTNSAGNEHELKIRPTLWVTVNGPDSNPELGLIHTLSSKTSEAQPMDVNSSSEDKLKLTPAITAGFVISAGDRSATTQQGDDHEVVPMDTTPRSERPTSSM